MSDVCLHPELAELTGPLGSLASQSHRAAADLRAAPDPDAHVICLDGRWHTCQQGRRRGATDISADHWGTREEALAEYVGRVARLAAQAAALAGGAR